MNNVNIISSSHYFFSGGLDSSNVSNNNLPDDDDEQVQQAEPQPGDDMEAGVKTQRNIDANKNDLQ